MRLNKILVVGCLMLGFPSACLSAPFNPDDLFTVKPTPDAAGAFARTTKKINSAVAGSNQKNLQAKLEFANAKIAQDPSNFKFYGGRGQIFRDLGDYRSAIKDFSQALALKPDNEHAQLYLEGRAAAKGLLNDNAGEIEDLNVALLKGPPKPNIFVMRAAAYHDLKQYREGISDATRALQMDSNCAEAYAIRAMLYFALNDSSHSMEDCNRAIALGTKTASVFDVRSRLYTAKGKSDLATADRNTFNQLSKTE